MKLIAQYAFIVSCLLLVSCGSEDVSGCMDIESQNFNSEATLDDGSCQYYSDAYVGTYDVVNSNCSPADGFFENLSITILKSGSEDPNSLGLVMSGLLQESKESQNFASVATSSSLEIDGGDGLRSRMIVDAFVWKGRTYTAFWFELKGSLTFDEEELVGRLRLTGTDVLSDNQTVVLAFGCDYRLIPQ